MNSSLSSSIYTKGQNSEKDTAMRRCPQGEGRAPETLRSTRILTPTGNLSLARVLLVTPLTAVTLTTRAAVRETW